MRWSPDRQARHRPPAIEEVRLDNGHCPPSRGHLPVPPRRRKCLVRSTGPWTGSPSVRRARHHGPARRDTGLGASRQCRRDPLRPVVGPDAEGGAQSAELVGAPERLPATGGVVGRRRMANPISSMRSINCSPCRDRPRWPAPSSRPQSMEVLLEVMRAGPGDRAFTTEPTRGDRVRCASWLSSSSSISSGPCSRRPPRPTSATPPPTGSPSSWPSGPDWSRNTPLVLSEHGIYLRERYLSYGHETYSSPLRSIMLRFFKRLTWAGYQIASAIAPGSEYNRQWQETNGAAPERINPIYNGVDPADFAASPSEPDVPTLVWLGRIDPLKDVETLIRSFAKVHEVLPEARLRIFGGASSRQPGLPRPLHRLAGLPRAGRFRHLRRTGPIGARSLPRRTHRAVDQHLGRLSVLPHRGHGLRACPRWPPTWEG